MATAETQLAPKPQGDIVQLGDGDVFIKRTPGGTIYTVKALITLREDHNEIAVIENKPMIAADGYYRMNQITSLAIITPDHIKIPWEDSTREVPNPFPIIDPVSGTQRGVWVKKVVVGYSPTGTLAISSNILYYNFTTYFLQDLHKKIQSNKAAGRLCFKDQVTADEEKRGIFLAIEGNLGLWADMNHADVLKCVSTWLQNKNFGERKAQTIAERNALKHHPALSVKIRGNLQGPEKHRVGQVLVIGWQHEHSRQELEEMARAADAGEELEERANVIETTGAPAPEDVIASEEIDEEMARAAEMAAEQEPDGQGRLF